MLFALGKACVRHEPNVWKLRHHAEVPSYIGLPGEEGGGEVRGSCCQEEGGRALSRTVTCSAYLPLFLLSSGELKESLKVVAGGGGVVGTQLAAQMCWLGP